MKDKKNLLQQLIVPMIVVGFGVILYQCIEHYGIMMREIRRFFALLSPFIIGVAIAYVLNPVMKFFEEKLFFWLKPKGPRRALSILLSFVLVLGALFGVTYLLEPIIEDSVSKIATELPTAAVKTTRTIKQFLESHGFDTSQIVLLSSSYREIVSFVVNTVNEYAPQVLNFSIGFGKGLYNVFIAMIAAIYMLAGKEKLTNQMKRLMYALFPVDKADRAMEILGLSHKTFGGFLGGKILDSAIIGVLCAVGMYFLKMPYIGLISVIVGITNIIPFFGPFIGMVPGFLIICLYSPIKAVEFALFILALQQLDGNVIGPRILGDSTGLSAFWVMFAIIICGGLFGIIGMLVGVPIFSVCFTLVSEWMKRKLGEKGLPTDYRGFEKKGKPEKEKKEEASQDEPALMETAGEEKA